MARILQAAREQLRDAANEAIGGALDALEARVAERRARASMRDRPGRQLERMREVLERDRALASASLPDEPPRATKTVTPADDVPRTIAPATPVVCDEPIRTRSMAKLLAAQGHADRALAIYAYLLAQDAGNAMLQAEAAALREAQRCAAEPGE